MFMELLDGLRCISEHPSIALVTAITKRDERFVIEGTAGCPTCRREYPIHRGIAWFGSAREPAELMPETLPDDNDGVTRVGAFLAVSDGITVALVGDWATYAPSLAGMVALRVFAVNPRVAVEESETVGVLYSDNRLPFADGSLRGIAIGDAGWSHHDVKMAARVLASGGRMVGPAALRLPDDIEEIARDDSIWIGEKRGPLVTLHRR
jgi:hypothetical protein